MCKVLERSLFLLGKLESCLQIIYMISILQNVQLVHLFTLKAKSPHYLRKEFMSSPMRLSWKLNPDRDQWKSRKYHDLR